MTFSPVANKTHLARIRYPGAAAITVVLALAPALLGGCTPRADLVVKSADITPTSICEPYKPVLDAKVTVKNIGNAASEGRSDVGLVGVIDSSAAGTSGGYWGNGVGLPAIAPGATAQASVPIYYLIADPAHMVGQHAFAVELNRAGWIDEGNRTNNSFGPITVTVPPVCGTRYLVLGSDMGFWHQNVAVQKQGQNVSTATVTVNGTPLTYGSDKYHGKLPAVLPVGGQLTLRVIVPEGQIQATDTVPEKPLVTAPASGATVSSSQPLHVTWTSQTNPDRFTVWVSWSCGNQCGTGRNFEVDGTARSFDVPTGTLPANTTVNLSVFSHNDGIETFTGPFAPGSRMAIRNYNEANGRPLQTVP